MTDLDPQVYDNAADALLIEGHVKGALYTYKGRCIAGALFNSLAMIYGFNYDLQRAYGLALCDSMGEEVEVDPVLQKQVDHLGVLGAWNDRTETTAGDAIEALIRCGKEIREHNQETLT